jgi:hypothetical protein
LTPNIFSSVSLNPPYLSVQKLLPLDYPSTKKIAEKWSESAYQRRDFILIKDNAQIQNPDSFQRLGDCGRISQKIGEILNRLENRPDQNTEIYRCIDGEKNWQAIMCIHREQDALCIYELVTHPWNIVPEEMREPTDKPTKRAGTVLIIQAISRAVELNIKTIYLRSLPSSVKFYEKLGFSLDDIQPCKSTCSMRLYRS